MLSKATQGVGVDVLSEVRSFNRFYTREIGLLDEHLPERNFTLAEVRILYELAQHKQTAADLGRALGIDKARLSRVISLFRTRGLVLAEPDPRHNKRLILSLTATGKSAFVTLDEGTRAQIAALLASVGDEQRQSLVSAMRTIKSTLRPDAAPPSVEVRRLRPGDLGWITYRQSVLYHREYGWDWTYEGLVAGILSQFVATFDPTREDAWVAERGGNVVGSIFLVKGAEPSIAKLSLLYVEPSARGLGIGQNLVSRCILRAREFGYSELTLWTNSVLVSARRIYEAAGFQLTNEEPHRSFGHDLTGQTWRLDLIGARP